MYEKIAWDNFLKTGNIESYLEYKRLAEEGIRMQNDVNLYTNIGDELVEFNKSKGDNNKRELL